MSGNTGTGVFKNDGPYSVYINLNKIAELKEKEIKDGIVLGANVTITDAINLLETTEDEVFVGVAHHMKKIASYGIRNQGSLAGNLMMKHGHNEFPSDVFLSLETAGATVQLASTDGALRSVAVGELPYMNMDKKVLVTITIPMQVKAVQKKGPVWKFRSYKIMPRSSNAHAYVNAGFKALVDLNDNLKVVGKPKLVFGGINARFVHASATEDFLAGKNLNDHTLFLEAMTILAEELMPEHDPVLANPIYRKQLAMGLFYKVHIFYITHLDMFRLK